MDFSAPHFAEPLALLLAPPLALTLVWLHLYAGRKRTRALRQFASAGDIARHVPQGGARRRHLKFAMSAAAALALVAALAGPRWGLLPGETLRTPEDVMLVVDTSRSMDAADVTPSRLGLAKWRIAHFLEKHRNGRVGLTAFSGTAITLCPPTEDRAALLDAVRNLDTHRSPDGGTDLAVALREAVHSLGPKAKHRTLVLVSDGEDLGARGVETAAELAGSGVVIHTIAVGTGQGATVATRAGTELTRAAPDTLDTLARTTGGLALPAQITPDDLDRLVARLPDDNVGRGAPQGVDRTAWALVLALVLIACERLVGSHPRTSRPTPAFAALIAVLLFPPAESRADDATLSPREHLKEGLRLLKSGAPASAEAHLKEALVGAPEAMHPVVLHNLGLARTRRALALVDKGAPAPDAESLAEISRRLTAMKTRLSAPDGSCDEQLRAASFYAVNRLLVTGADAVKRSRERIHARRDAPALLHRAAGDFAAAAELDGGATEALRHAQTARRAATRLEHSLAEEKQAAHDLNRALESFYLWAGIQAPASNAQDGSDPADEEPPGPMSEAEAQALLESIRNRWNNTLPVKPGVKSGGRADGNNR